MKKIKAAHAEAQAEITAREIEGVEVRLEILRRQLGFFVLFHTHTYTHTISCSREHFQKIG
jgi:hypothetical protein